MVDLRSPLLLMLLALALAIVGCERIEGGGLAPDTERQLLRGRQHAAAWIAKGRTEAAVEPEIAVALGYLERHRLGLGSPFRLIDYALNDPRLDEETRTQVAWALLARTLDRQAYQVDPAALDRTGPQGLIGERETGRAYLELIDHAITEARDPRGGELAVRLAYTLAEAEGSVGRRASGLATNVAALIRDRELAHRDAVRLIRTAEAAGTDAIRLVPTWRAERKFSVEEPALTPLPLAIEREAMELAPRLALAIQALPARLAMGVPPSYDPRPLPTSVLGPGAASVLDSVTAAFNPPPQTPVVVAVDVHSRQLVDDPTLDRAERSHRRHFVEKARNEERLAAQYALLMEKGAGAGEAPARAVLAAAVGLRTYAQERVWFPGHGGPSARELEDRFGLAFVRFDDSVPATWRPYYRRMLAEAFGDLQRVLPSLDLRGLGIRFGQSGSRHATLAIHDPRRRTIFLPPETGAGTIAHEVAHDLDWQVALRRYRVRGDYGTDRAMRHGGDLLASSLQQLTTATLLPPRPGDPAPVSHAQRPAEVFARSVDWFVVVSLAREGRMNGYLSSAQDEVLTGYGTVEPPDISGAAGQAIVSILDEVAPIYPETREWFLRSYGPSRSLTVQDLVRRATDVEFQGEMAFDLDDLVRIGGGQEIEPGPPHLMAGGGIKARFTDLARTRDAVMEAIDAWACRIPEVASDTRLEAARRQIAAQALAARARGLALQYAGELAGDEGRRWMVREFYGAPWPTVEIDPAIAEILTDIASEARRLGAGQIEAEPGAFRFPNRPRRCSAWPLLASADRAIG